MHLHTCESQSLSATMNTHTHTHTHTTQRTYRHASPKASALHRMRRLRTARMPLVGVMCTERRWHSARAWAFDAMCEMFEVSWQRGVHGEAARMPLVSLMCTERRWHSARK